MATKKTSLGNPDLEDLNLDDLGLPNSTTSDADKAAKKRKPLTKVATGFADGAKQTLTSKSFIKRTISDALPRGYGTAINTADSAVQGAKELYNSAAQELRPAVPVMRKAVEKTLPKASKILPKSVAKKLDAFAKGGRPNGGMPTQADYDNQQITGAMAEIFKTSLEQQTVTAAVDQGERRLQHEVMTKQARASINQLMGIRQGIDRQVAYQDQVNARYQQKSLELQYRQYFTLRDMLKLQITNSERDKQYFEALVLNTGLPETQKIKSSERYKSGLKDMLYGRSQQAAVSYISQFGKRLRGNLGAGMRGALGGLSAGIQGMGEAADAAEMAKEFGIDMDGYSLAGNMAGGFAADRMGRRLGRYIRGKTSKNDKIRRGGAKLSYLLDTAPERLGSFARSSAGESGKMGWLVRMLKDAIPRPNRDVSLGESPIMGADQPANFTAHTQRSIVEVIPGFLSRIYQELQSIRTGKKVKRVEYNMLRGQFTNTGTTTEDARKLLFGKQAMGTARYGMQQVVDDIDPQNKLSPATRQALMRQIMLDVGNGRAFEPSRLVNEGTDTSQLSTEHKAELRGHFQQRYKNNDGSFNYETAAETARRQRSLTTYLPDPRTAMMALMQTGNREALDRLGLITSTGNGDKMNLERVLDLMMGGMNGEEVPGQAGRGPGGSRGPVFGMPPGHPGGGMVSPSGTPHSPLGPTPGMAYSAVSPEEKLGISRREEQLEAILKSIRDSDEHRATEGQAYMQGLSQLAALLAAGGGGGGGGSGISPQQLTRFGLFGRWGGKAVGAGMGAAKLFGRGMASYTKAVYGTMFQGAKASLGLLKIPRTILGSARDYVTDVYVKGQKEPVLYAERLRRGEYRNRATGKVIKSIRDIKGEVIDAQGNIVLSANDYAQGLYSKGKRILRNVWKTLGAMGSGYAAMVRAPFQMLNLAGKMVQGGINFANRPQDVYVKGEKRPRLMKVLMQAGEYFDRKTGKAIRKPKDIKGEVVDKDGNIMLSVEDLKTGVVNARGKPFRSLLARLGGLVGGTLSLGGDLLKGYFKMVGSAAGAGFNLLSGLFTRIGGIFNPKLFMAYSTKSTTLLEKIYNLLDARVPIPEHLRKGSWQDQALHGKKAKPTTKVEKAKAAASNGWSQLKGWLADKLGGKKKKDDDDDSNLLQDGEDLLEKGGKKGGWLRKGKALLKRGGRTLGRSRAGRLLSRMGGRLANSRVGGMVARAAESRLGGAAMRAGGGVMRAGGGLLRAGLGLGRGALALAGLGEGAGALGAIGGGLATAASGVGSALAGIGSAAAGLLSAPVLLTAGAVAAVGAAAYYGYKYYTLKKDQPLRKFRMAQYGLDITKGVWPMGKVLALEDKVKEHITYGKNTANIETKDLAIPELLNIMGLKKSWYNPTGWFHSDNEQDGKNEQAFLRWFSGRFKPVFLNWMATLHGMGGKVDIGDADDKLAAPDKLKLLDAANGVDGSVYGVMDSPFGEDPLTATGDTVAMAYKEVKARINAELKKSKDGKVSDTSKAIAKVLPGAAAAAAAAKGAQGAGKAGASAQMAKLGMADAQAAASAAMTLKGAPPPKSTILGKTLTALLSIRLKTYGLKELTNERVKCLFILEQDVFEKLTFDADGTAKFDDKPEDYYAAYAAQFGSSPSDDVQKARWIAWFTKRFMPTVLQFASAVKRANKNVAPGDADNYLKPAQLVEVATATIASMYSVRGIQISVWKYTLSPWDEVPLNDDSTSTADNLNVLKAAVAKQVFNEQTAKTTKAVDKAAPKSPIKQATAAMSAAADGVGKVADTFNSPAAMRQAMQTARGVGEGAGLLQPGESLAKTPVGKPLQQPGNGTGGDINKVPMPNGDRGWDAVKGTILSAAKMVGVSPDLMATMANIESGFNPNAKAGTSSATGLYQFIDSTWKAMLLKYGNKYGIDPNTPQTDARANALMGAEFLKENQLYLQKALGRAPTDSEMYLAHFLGPAGAKAMLTSSKSALAAQVNSAAARANPSIFYNKGTPRTTAEVVQVMDNLVRKKGGWDTSTNGLVDGTSTMLAKAPDTGGHTTTTANGPKGGLGPALMGMPKLDPNGLPKGPGYAAMTDKEAANTVTSPRAVVAPSIDRSTSLAVVAGGSGSDTASRYRGSQMREAEVGDQRAQQVNEQLGRQIDTMVGYMGKQVGLLEQILASHKEQVALLGGIHSNTGLAKDDTPAPSGPSRNTPSAAQPLPTSPVSVKRTGVG